MILIVSLFCFVFLDLLRWWQTRVDPAQDIIYVNGSRLAKKLPPKVYLALNKPKGFVQINSISSYIGN